MSLTPREEDFFRETDVAERVLSKATWIDPNTQYNSEKEC